MKGRARPRRYSDGGTATVTVSGIVTGAGTLSNTVSAATDIGDHNLANNSATVGTAVETVRRIYLPLIMKNYQAASRFLYLPLILRGGSAAE